MRLDKEEKAILKAFEAGKAKRSKNARQLAKKAKQAAETYFRKDARISIRLSSADLQAVKQRANQEGLPYQTLIASVIHKFVTGYRL